MMAAPVAFASDLRQRSDLRPYQAEEAARIAAGESRAVLFQMGAGKTITALTGIADAAATSRVRRVLLVSTPTIIRSTWPDEIAAWEHLQGLKYAALVGTSRQREKALGAALEAPGAVIVATTFDTVQHMVPHAAAFDMLVIDEASLSRNPKSRRFKSLAKIAVRVPQRIAMTGSPAPNRATELWGVIALVDLGAALGTNWGEFLNRYTRKYGDRDWQRRDLPHARAEIAERIRHLVTALTTADVVSMPSLQRRVTMAVLPDDARLEYETLEATGISLAAKNRTHRDALLVKLQTAANGFVYDDDGNIVRLHDAKIDALAQIVESCMAEGEQVVVVYSFVGDLEAIKARIPDAVVLRSGQDAAETVRRWNRSEIDVLVFQYAVGSHGLNLQNNPRGRTLIFASATWSSERYEQVVARIHRPGQSRTVQVFMITAEDTIDDVIVSVVSRKISGQDAIFAALKERRLATEARTDANAQSLHELARAARKRAARLHPDAGGTEAQFVQAWREYQQILERI